MHPRSHTKWHTLATHLSHSLVPPPLHPLLGCGYGAAPASLLLLCILDYVVLSSFTPPLFLKNPIRIYFQLFTITYNSTHNSKTRHAVSHFPPFFPAVCLRINGCLPCTPHIIATDEDSGLGRNVWLIIDT